MPAKENLVCMLAVREKGGFSPGLLYNRGDIVGNLLIYHHLGFRYSAVAYFKVSLDESIC